MNDVNKTEKGLLDFSGTGIGASSGFVPGNGKVRKAKFGRQFWILLFCLAMVLVSALLLYRVLKY